jgi:predicted ATPase
MTPTQIIASLNAITCGDLEGIRLRIEEARTACEAIGQPGLVDCLNDALAALASGDLRTYRKRIETTIARLGHLR